MRIYEFAKKSNISAKKAVAMLRKGGFAVASHMALLDDSARKFLEQSLGQNNVNTKAVISASTEGSAIKEIKKTTQPGPYKYTDKTRSSAPRALEPEKLVLQPMAIGEISQATGIPISQLIMQLMRWGQLVGKNQTISAEMVGRVAQEYGIPVVEPDFPVAEGLKLEGGSEQRLPVVVVLGHVDHGKTTLLDFIRKTRVASREKGGITQHLGAYEAKTNHGRLIFLDTPGHEAFTKIRQRGARVADIAILVVSADDSIMPQTLEAIEHIRGSKIPFVVAINKIDKVGPEQIDIVRRGLAQYDLLPEEWGGSTVVCPISAKEGTNVDELLELVSLQAELLELTTTTEGGARGYVLESSMERGRGPVATVLLRQGTLKVGDYFKAGSVRGRVSSIIDSFGKNNQMVNPSIPVRIAGFERLPEAGDLLIGIEKSEYKKFTSGSDRLTQMRFIPENAINLIVKTDTKSSREALLDSIAKLSGKMSKKYTREFYVVDSGVGDVVETDVLLAESSGAKILSLHMKISSKAQELANRSGVQIECYDIIYKLLEELERMAYEGRKIVTVKEKTGTAEVRKVFDVKGLGVIAGCYVRDGSIVKNGFIKALRNGYSIGEGPIVSLQSEKKNIKEVKSGRECGFIIKEITEWQEGDLAECYIEVKR